MSKYTTELRYICETESGLEESVGYNDVANVIANSRGKIFSFGYPIFDENYRATLETKILKHYYTREICEETYGLWKLRLDQKMNEIMPYYNQLYKSALLEFNPFYDVDITTEHSTTQNLQGSFENTTQETGEIKTKEQNKGKETTTDTINKNEPITRQERDLYSDTPQSGLDKVEDGEYLTNARFKEFVDTGERTSTLEFDDRVKEITTGFNDRITKNEGGNENTTTEEYLESVKGKRGGQSYAKLLDEYRKTFLNIDLMVVNELNDLFMLLW